MDNPSISPENMRASEREILLYRLQSLFLEYDPREPVPWAVRRYIDGRRENTLDISHSPDTGSYLLDARLRNPSSMISEKLIISDALVPGGKFLSSRNTDVEDDSYNEQRAMLFNDLLIRSTSRPYGRFGRMILRAKFRFAI